METCTTCGSSFDPETKEIPSVLPDFMCADCGTQLTEEDVKSIPSPFPEQNEFEPAQPIVGDEEVVA